MNITFRSAPISPYKVRFGCDREKPEKPPENTGDHSAEGLEPASDTDETIVAFRAYREAMGLERLLDELTDDNRPDLHIVRDDESGDTTDD